MTNVIVNGMHSVSAPEPCHIVDLTILGCTKECERLRNIIYSVLVDCCRTEQAPFGERYLDVETGEIIGDDRYGRDHPEIWTSNVRVAFLMHFLEPDAKIATPYGPAVVPSATPTPKRLAAILYESPY